MVDPLRAAVAALTIGLLSGCATTTAPRAVPAAADDATTATSATQSATPTATPSARDPASSLPVAVNLVSVLVQLDGYSPYATTIQVSEPSSEFGVRLTEALELAGYGVQRVSADQGANYLSYRSARSSGETGTRIDYTLRLGALSIGRTVRSTDAGVVPIGPVRIRGARPQPIALNGSIYVTAPATALSYPSGVRFESDAQTTVAEARYRYDYRPTGAARVASDATPLEPARFLDRATRRLYTRGTSTVGFTTRPDEDFSPLGQVALRFPTRSDDVLGTGNRAALERLLEYVDTATDRLTLTSCDGEVGDSRASAAARSARVKSELLTLGVAGAQVREVGCERRRYGAPQRTVTVRLERLIDTPVAPN